MERVFSESISFKTFSSIKLDSEPWNIDFVEVQKGLVFERQGHLKLLIQEVNIFLIPMHREID